MKQDKDYQLPAAGALKVNQSVELEVISETDLGYKAVVDDRYIGLIYRSEISRPLERGQYLTGWIKALRDDGKIDLSITRLDDESRNALEEQIMRYLHKQGGEAPLSDRSTPAEIHGLFGASKSSFKRAIGRLYKAKKILIEDSSLRLLVEPPKPASPWGKKKG